MKITPQEKQKIYTQAKHRLGAPIRKIQLEEEQLDSLLEIATQDYVEHILNYIIEHQWPSLIGLNIDEADLTRAFISRGQDLVTQYTYSYSKIVGLGAGEGGFVLKKDYIEIVPGQQMYLIPPNREINEVMWFNPPTINRATIDPTLGLWGLNFGGVLPAVGSFYMLPASDIILRGADLSLKQRVVRSDLTYKITNAPNGGKYIHLINEPRTTVDFFMQFGAGSKVWYWYYDINPENKDECFRLNKDIVKSPADVPLDNIDFDDLNVASKTWIRRYFIALCKETLGRVRGTFGGKLPVPGADVEIEYQSLLSEGKDEMVTLKTELNGFLTRLSPLEIMKRISEEATYVNTSLKFRAFNTPIRIF